MASKSSDRTAKFSEAILCNISKAENLRDCKIIGSSGIDHKGENFLGIVSRLTVQGVNENGDKKDVHLFVKVPPERFGVEADTHINKVYKRECLVYTTYLPAIVTLQQDGKVPNDQILKFARCYKANYDDFEEILVFEDLSFLHYTNYDRLKPLDYDHVMLVINTIAQFHALGFAIKNKNQKLFQEFKDISFVMAEMEAIFGEEALTELINKFTDQINDPENKKKIKKYAESEIVQQYLASDDKEDNPYKIMCHGDCWSNNILFKYEEEKPVDAILIDWQLLLYDSPVTDLITFIFSATDGAFRKKFLEEVWKKYYETFRLTLSKVGLEATVIYPEEVFRQHIQELYPMSLISALMFLPAALNKKEDALELKDMFNSDGTISTDCFKFSEDCIRRLEEIIDDLVELNFL